MKIAKDINVSDLPFKIYNEQVQIPTEKIQDSFADFFFLKIKSLMDNTLINREVYNGRQKIIPEYEMFMDRERIIECIKSIKLKGVIEFHKES